MLGKGRAEAITDAHIAVLADRLRVHPADLQAFDIVESGGFGWFSDGRMKILNEKHWVYKTCSKKNRKLLINKGLARRRWISPKRGGYKEQNSATQRYSIFSKIRDIDRNAAYMSISMGTRQIMGFNHMICGFKSAEQMFDAFLDSEKNQLEAFGNFLLSKKIVAPLRAGNFERCETLYNGGGLNGRYARRMRRESAILKKGKWANYIVGSYKIIDKKPATKPATKPTPKPVAKSKSKSWVDLFMIIVKLIFRKR